MITYNPFIDYQTQLLIDIPRFLDDFCALNSTSECWIFDLSDYDKIISDEEFEYFISEIFKESQSDPSCKNLQTISVVRKDKISDFNHTDFFSLIH